jgi:hypothetical protein
MTVRSAVLRSMLVVVASTFAVAAKVASVGGGSGGQRGGEYTMTPPGPLGPSASAGRQVVLTGVGPGPENEQDD